MFMIICVWKFHNFASINIKKSSNVENWHKKNIEDVHLMLSAIIVIQTLVAVIVTFLVKVQLHKECREDPHQLNDLSN